MSRDPGPLQTSPRGTAAPAVSCLVNSVTSWSVEGPLPGPGGRAVLGSSPSQEMGLFLWRP